jgi:hypothetical protein
MAGAACLLLTTGFSLGGQPIDAPSPHSATFSIPPYRGLGSAANDDSTQLLSNEVTNSNATITIKIPVLMTFISSSFHHHQFNSDYAALYLMNNPTSLTLSARTPSAQ